MCGTLHDWMFFCFDGFFFVHPFQSAQQPQKPIFRRQELNIEGVVQTFIMLEGLSYNDIDIDIFFACTGKFNLLPPPCS